MKGRILKMLRENGGYLSGQELCEKLGVSRTAVWKWIKKLQEEGYEIQAVPNRGYRLTACPDLVTAEACAAWMRGEWAGKQIWYGESVDSTNTQAKRLAEDGAPHGLLAVAEAQTMGKGRRGRQWISEGGEAIYMSLLLRPEISPEKAPAITLLMALAAEEGIRKLSGLDTLIKWPNDVVAEGKKLCGILTEMSADLDGVRYVVTGAGINVNQEKFPPETPNASSMRLLSGRTFRRAELIGLVLEAFEKYYGIFMKTGDMSGLKEAYEARLANRDREVRVLEEKPWQGIARGIDERGELLVEDQEGVIRTVLSGEVSVRGIYGYV